MIAAFARIEQGSIPETLIFAVVRVVSICFQKISGIAVIAGVVHSGPNDLNDYMETRLKQDFLPRDFQVKICSQIFYHVISK